LGSACGFAGESSAFLLTQAGAFPHCIPASAIWAFPAPLGGSKPQSEQRKFAISSSHDFYTHKIKDVDGGKEKKQFTLLARTSFWSRDSKNFLLEIKTPLLYQKR
jgi:hypothetical protein